MRKFEKVRKIGEKTSRGTEKEKKRRKKSKFNFKSLFQPQIGGKTLHGQKKLENSTFSRNFNPKLA